MRIVTWNMARQMAAWTYLVDVIKPDYALLQEARVTEVTPGFVKWQPIGANSIKYGARGRYAWGSAVWSQNHDLREVAHGARPGWVQAARPVKRGSPLLVSTHVELDRAGRSIPTLHRILSDLTPLIERNASNLILGGDLNADVEFDRRHETCRHAIAFERIEEFGLWHCNQLVPPARRVTFPRESVMDDHLFVGGPMKARVVSCEVLDSEGVPGDHYPVLVEIREG